MRLRASTFTALVAVPILAAAAAIVAPLPPSARAAEIVNGLAAVVNGKPITWAEVREAVRAQEMVLRRQYPLGGPEFEAKVGEARKEGLQALIDQQLILSAFEEKGGIIKPQYVDEALEREIRELTGGDREKFIAELRKAGMTFKKYREQITRRLIVQYMRAAETRDVAPPTPQEREQYLAENPDKFREKSLVKLRTITVPKLTGDPTITVEDQRRFIGEIRQRIAEGADFAAQAREYSVDSVAEDGGDRQWIDDQSPTLNSTVTEAAFALRPGQLSSVVEDPNAFYLLLVEDKQVGKMKPRSEIEDDLNSLVLLEKRKKANDEWLERLRKQATIKILEVPS